MYGEDYVKTYDERSQQEFRSIKPTDASIDYEHVYLRGNAGPEIVNLSQEGDLVVLATQGRSAMLRLVIGSVAQYVLRHANCPVIMARGLVEISEDEAALEKHYVTEIMDHVAPVQKFNNILEVSQQLIQAGESAAPIVDVKGKCIGILTRSDIENYESLKKRYAEKDPAVLNEMFEVDKYGMRRSHNHNFEYVERHMTSEVISIENSGTIEDAIQLFEANPDIHHLVVVDDKERPVGIVDSVRAFTSAEYGKIQQAAGNEVIEQEEEVKQ